VGLACIWPFEKTAHGALILLLASLLLTLSGIRTRDAGIATRTFSALSFVASAHHERLDGNGYPRDLREKRCLPSPPYSMGRRIDRVLASHHPTQL